LEQEIVGFVLKKWDRFGVEGRSYLPSDMTNNTKKKKRRKKRRRKRVSSFI
jgi:hypothetical protein